MIIKEERGFYIQFLNLGYVEELNNKRPMLCFHFNVDFKYPCQLQPIIYAPNHFLW